MSASCCSAHGRVRCWSKEAIALWYWRFLKIWDNRPLWGKSNLTGKNGWYCRIVFLVSIGEMMSKRSTGKVDLKDERGQNQREWHVVLLVTSHKKKPSFLLLGPNLDIGFSLEQSGNPNSTSVVKAAELSLFGKSMFILSSVEKKL